MDRIKSARPIITIFPTHNTKLTNSEVLLSFRKTSELAYEKYRTFFTKKFNKNIYLWASKWFFWNFSFVIFSLENHSTSVILRCRNDIIHTKSTSLRPNSFLLKILPGLWFKYIVIELRFEIRAPFRRCIRSIIFLAEREIIIVIFRVFYSNQNRTRWCSLNSIFFWQCSKLINILFWWTFHSMSTA